MPYGTKLHTPPSNYHLLAAQQKPYVQKVFSLFTSLIPRKIRGGKMPVFEDIYWNCYCILCSYLVALCSGIGNWFSCMPDPCFCEKKFWKLSNHRKQWGPDRLVRSNHSYATMSKLRNPAAMNPPAERLGHFPPPCQRSRGDCPLVIAAPHCCPTPVA